MYASFWHRGFAFLFDCLLVYAAVYLIHVVFGSAEPIVTSPLAWTTGILFFWLYFAALESSLMQATLGKRLAGIVVTDAEGERISFARASVRTFAKFLSALPFFFGFIIGAYTVRNRALHDYVAGTVVLFRIIR